MANVMKCSFNSMQIGGTCFMNDGLVQCTVIQVDKSKCSQPVQTGLERLHALQSSDLECD